MKESERLAEKGMRLLHNAGWPKEAIEEVATTLMAAGMARWAEEHASELAAQEALIQKVTAN